jgi:hypothetical protein
LASITSGAPLNGGSHPIGVTGAPVKVDLQIAADDPAGLLELAAEYRGAESALRIVVGIHHERADPAGPPALLRVRCQRPCCR